MSYIPRQLLAVSSFGELVVAEPHPVTQMAATHGLGSKAFAFPVGTGTASTDNGEFACTTGTGGLNNFGLITSRRGITYKAGTGVQARFTARFTTPVVDSYQIVGLIGIGNQIGFGCVNNAFGVTREHGGYADLQLLTVTAAATVAEVGVVTIDTVPHNVNLTNAGGDVNFTAAEIAAELNADVTLPLITFTANQDTVMARNAVNGPHALFTFASATAAGTFFHTKTGVLATNYFKTQSEWNIDKMDGTGPSGVHVGAGQELDPFDGGIVCEVQFQYLGYGNVLWMIADPHNAGVFFPVHVHKWLADGNTGVNMSDPNYLLGLMAASQGTTTDLTVRSASMGLFNDGQYVLHEESRSTSRLLLTIASATVHHVLTVRCRTHLGGRSMSAEVIPLLMKYGTESNKGVEFNVYKNAINWGTNLIFDYQNETGSLAEVSKTTTTLTSMGTASLIYTGVLLLKGTDSIDLSIFDTYLAPGETLSITVNHLSEANKDATASLVWKEDI